VLTEACTYQSASIIRIQSFTLAINGGLTQLKVNGKLAPITARL
jgi:hypothetical protein